MSKIDEMLKNEKVEWRKLGEVIEKHSQKARKYPELKTVYTVSKDYGIIPSLEYWTKTASEYRRSYQIYSDDTSNYNVIRQNMFAYNPARLNIGSISCLLDGEDGLISPMYVVFKLNEELLSPKYLLYYIKSPKILFEIESMKEEGARFRFDFKNWDKIEIPIPSLKTQEKIVKILDKFTNYVTELQAELQAELQFRTKQYEYYRDMLLSENYLNKISEKIEVVAKEGASKLYCTTLGDIAKICMCKRILKEQTFSDCEVPFYKIGTFGKSADAFISKQLFDEYKQKYNYPKKGEILISASGTIGKAIVFDGQDSYFQDSNIVWLSHDETKVLNRYLYYFYQIINWNPSTGGTISRLYNYN